MYLKHLNYFRGFAIFLIVLGHSLYPTKFLVEESIESLNIYEKLIIGITLGGTTLFVFISGFLFHHIFYKRGFNFEKFLRSKIRNVFIPYSIIILPIWTYLSYKDIFNLGKVTIKNIIESLLLYFSGRSLASTWYIPFALLLFIASPLFIKYIELKKYKKRIIFIGVIVSMIIHRPIHDLTINIFQALLYFSPAYCLGIYFSENHEKVMKWLIKYYNIVVLTYLFIVFIQIRSNKIFNSHKSIFDISIYDLDYMSLQKILLCMIFMGLFYKMEIKNYKINKFLEILAEFSFPIFFVHEYFFLIFLKLEKTLNLNLNLKFWQVIVFTIIICILCIILTKTIKIIFKNKSRMIIGY